MGNIQNTVDLTIKEISAVKGTKPRFHFDLLVEPSNNRISIEEMIGQTEFQPEESKTNLKGPRSVVPSGGLSRLNNEHKFTLPIEISTAELDRIEKLREGGDITIKLTLQITTEDRNENRNSGSITLTEELLDGHWSRLLSTLDYHDIRTIEMNVSPDNPHIRDQLDTVYGKIENAQHKHDIGDYPSAIVNCRRAIESLNQIDEIDGLLDERKLDDLNGIMGNFKSFTGGLSHAEEQTDIEPAMQRDSEFALRITKSCATYVSTVVDENG